MINAVKLKVMHVPINVSEYGMNNTQVTMFYFKEVTVRLLSNMDVMDHFNLLFYDNDDPSKCHPAGGPIE